MSRELPFEWLNDEILNLLAYFFPKARVFYAVLISKLARIQFMLAWGRQEMPSKSELFLVIVHLGAYASISTPKCGCVYTRKQV